MIQFFPVTVLPLGGIAAAAYGGNVFIEIKISHYGIYIAHESRPGNLRGV
jgi:hypothetical protein